jgi:hypothetical protein
MEKNPDNKPLIDTLFVFLHGLITLVDVNKLGFLAYMLDVGEDHRYLCGNWLLEREVKANPPQSYPILMDEVKASPPQPYPTRMQLVGVHAGHAKLDEGLNFIVKLSAQPNSPEIPLRAVITLPRPRKIYYYNQGLMHKECCGGTTSRFSKYPTVVSGLRVFEYRFDDYREVALVNEHGRCIWECAKPAPSGRKNVATVHIYDEPQEGLSGDHNLREFNLSLKFLGVTDIELRDSSAERQINDLVLPGVLAGETSTLDERDPAVVRMLFQARRHKIFDFSDAGGAGGTQVCGGVNGAM